MMLKTQMTRRNRVGASFARRGFMVLMLHENSFLRKSLPQLHGCYQVLLQHKHPRDRIVKSTGIEESTTFSRVDTCESISEMETVSIRDYISKPNEQIHYVDFLCKATVVGVLERNGWSCKPLVAAANWTKVAMLLGAINGFFQTFIRT